MVDHPNQSHQSAPVARSQLSGASPMKRFLVETAITTVLGFGMWYLMKPLIEDVVNKDGKEQKGNAQRLQKILERREEERTVEDGETKVTVEVQPLVLNTHEQQVAEGVVDPLDMLTCFSDIGGIDDCKSEIYDLVVMPLKFPELYMSGGVESPKGILLYGAPGTGKTMLAKAIAKEGGAAFVNVKLSSIMNKWFGESQRLVSAVFSLARKLAPSVIFIDEIDTFLRQRDGETGDTSLSSMKSEFLTLWDGILSDRTGDTKPVIVLGATNRPYDVDTAILRRLPRTFEIGLPDASARFDILKLQLATQRLSTAGAGCLKKLAAQTVGFSGADLKELTRAAAMEPVREITEAYSKQAVNKQKGGAAKVKITKDTVVRPIDVRDFMAALQKVQRTGAAAEAFRAKEKAGKAGMNRDGGPSVSGQDVQMLCALLMQNMQNGQQNQSRQGGGGEHDGVEVLD